MAKDNSSSISRYTVSDDLTSLGSGGGGSQTYTFYDSNGNIVNDEKVIAEYITNHPEMGVDFDNPFVQVKINDGSFWGNKVKESNVASLVHNAAVASVPTSSGITRYKRFPRGDGTYAYTFYDESGTIITDEDAIADFVNADGTIEVGPEGIIYYDHNHSQWRAMESDDWDATGSTEADLPDNGDNTPNNPADTPKDETPKGESDGVTDSSISEGNGDSSNPDSSAYWSAHKDEIASGNVKIYTVEKFKDGTFMPTGGYGDLELEQMLYADYIDESLIQDFITFQTAMNEKTDNIVKILDDVITTLDQTNSNQYMTTGDGDATTNGERLKKTKKDILDFKEYMQRLTSTEFENTVTLYNNGFTLGKMRTRVYLLRKRAIEINNQKLVHSSEGKTTKISRIRPLDELWGDQRDVHLRERYYRFNITDISDEDGPKWQYDEEKKLLYYIKDEIINASNVSDGSGWEALQNAEEKCTQKAPYIIDKVNIR